ncbi:MAG: NAD(P)/FAD-dependent oxidoreductase [Actinobacteria bacterium]|nr:NAD(P)/FAD-dependent oxidoreductase [Actinomycetota bacterium]
MAEAFDLIVIGAGSAARDGAKKAAREHGARVALVERARWGGSCPNVACKPTKAYLVAAELVHDINTLAGKLGIEVGPARANLARVKARKDSLIKPQPTWVEDLKAAGFTTYDGEAALVDAHTVRVGNEELQADRILIATGSRTAVPPIEGIDDVDWIDHVSALELTELPESLLILGGGAVGLEFGQTLARFGSKVTIVDGMDHIAPRSDPAAAAELAAALEDEGIELVTNTFVSNVRQEEDGIEAVLSPRDRSPERTLRATRLMLASGRVPNVEELGLEQVGVETTYQGIVVDEHLRTSVEGIWAAGDVTAVAQFTPVAQYQARIAIADMFGAEASADYDALPTAIFTDPELAQLGLTEAEARDKGFQPESVRHDLKDVQRASYTDSKHGLYKLVFDGPTRRLLGVHVVSRSASDIVQGLAVAMKLGATVDDLAHVHHAFPTLGEGIKAAAEQAS